MRYQALVCVLGSWIATKPFFPSQETPTKRNGGGAISTQESAMPTEVEFCTSRDAVLDFSALLCWEVAISSFRVQPVAPNGRRASPASSNKLDGARKESAMTPLLVFMAQ